MAADATPPSDPSQLPYDGGIGPTQAPPAQMVFEGDPSQGAPAAVPQGASYPNDHGDAVGSAPSVGTTDKQGQFTGGAYGGSPASAGDATYPEAPRGLGPASLGASGSPTTQFNPMPIASATRTDDATPGDALLEGLQTPSISLQKLAPREIQINRESTFQFARSQCRSSDGPSSLDSRSNPSRHGVSQHFAARPNDSGWTTHLAI